jgi:DNA-binding SARP family transcriptional activator
VAVKGETDQPWRVQVLGPVQVLRTGGGLVEIAQTKVRSVLAHLALAQGAAVGTDQLIEGLWADDPPRSAVKTLHGYVARLRRSLVHDIVLTSGNGYRLNTGVAMVDSVLLADLVDQAAAEPVPKRRAGLLDQALGLYRGTPLADVPSEYLHARYGAGLVERRLAVLEDWAQTSLEAGETDVVSALLAATAEHPFRERLWELLIRAQARCGQRTEAMRSYQRVRNLLRDQLGVEPGEGLRSAHRQALAPGTVSNRNGQVDPPLGPHGALERDVAAGLAAAAQGRADEGMRSVVLHGAPGCGKTTVARHIAETVRHAFPGGVTAISLADEPCTSDPSGIARRLMRCWRVPAPGRPTEVVFAARQAWQEQACLLVIDDVYPGVQLGDLLPAPPRCAAIVCSTSSVVSPGKVSYQLVDRFPERQVADVLREHIGAERWEEDPRAAHRLVEFSDGLAAAVHVITMRLAPRSPLTVTELVDRLAMPERRLAELTAGGVSVRSHFLRAYERLNPMQQRAFRLLSLIEAPNFPLRVASACLHSTEADARDLLDELHACHLLYVSTVTSSGARYRFGTLEALFARELSRYTDSAPERATAVNRALSAWYVRGGPVSLGAPADGTPGPQLMPMSSRQTVR